MYSRTMPMSSLLISVDGNATGKASSARVRLGMIAPIPPAMIIPEPSERDSQRTSFPLTLFESKFPGKQSLEVKEIALAETFAASPPQIRGNEAPSRSKLLIICP